MVFTSRAIDPTSGRPKKSDGEQGKELIASLSWKLSQVKKQIQADRLASVQERIESNRKNLKLHTIELFEASRRLSDDYKGENLLSVRMESPPCRLAKCEWIGGVGEKEMVAHNQEEGLSSETIVIDSCGSNKSSVVCLLKLPFVEKIPPYSTWIFLSKNQRMAEDQSVVGRRRIYYDPLGSEALICSDTDEEIAEPEEEKHEFSEGEDKIMRKALQDHELTQEVLGVLCQFVNATPDEIEERCETLSRNRGKNANESKFSIKPMLEDQLFLDKTLSGCLDSFDNLFCRRCLVFDCRLHGCSQTLITPSEKLSCGVEIDDKRKPCGNQCYLMRKKIAQDQCYGTGTPNKVEQKVLPEEISSTLPSESDSNPDEDNSNPNVSDSPCADERMASDSAETSDSQTQHLEDMPEKDDNDDVEIPLKSMGKRKILKDRIKLHAGQDPSLRNFTKHAGKKQKRSGSKVALNDEDMIESPPTSNSGSECPDPVSCTPVQLQEKAIDETIMQLGRTGLSSGNSSNNKVEEANESSTLKKSSSFSKRRDSHGWNTIEKDLYLKGIEIFGKNSCLIARNLLSGLKTCMEVGSYMFNGGASLASRPLLRDSSLEDSEKADQEYPDDIPARARILRRRGKARKLKYTWKTAGHPSIRKRIADGKQQSCRQYTPCGCQQTCSKECPCIINATCCEKYCGCSKSCKNRFRGCHCAKSQCRSRQCPCFAAGRECDPDVCRNCWVSCGGGSLGEPPARGDGYQCGNMKLLLKQQERIMLAKSDVAGWGAFIKNPVNKNDYLGEYTGELISHREADKRGKIYDRANSSFLFDLNDQFVLDAYRKGDKLKFANHSSNPNCYAKVMLVAGDHRVGIYAKEHIDASEELFYDYRYGPDQAPAWARKPEGSKRDDASSSHSRAHKVA